MADTRLPADNIIETAIRNAVRKRIAELAEEEVAAIPEKVRQRINGEVDRIALAMLSEFDMYRDGRNLHITVKKLESKDAL